MATAAAAAVGPGNKGKFPETINLTRPSAFQPSSGARKLVIKNLRPPSANREAKVAEYYTRTEHELYLALDAVLAGQKPALPFERLFRSVEDLCRHGDAEKVYRTLKDRMENYVNNYIQPSVPVGGSGSRLETVNALYNHWAVFNNRMVRPNPTRKGFAML